MWRHICSSPVKCFLVYWTRNTISNVRWFICGSYYINIFITLYCYIYVHILAVYENIEHINSVDTVWLRRFFLRWEISSYSVWTQMRSFYFLIVRRDLWSDYFLLKPLSQLIMHFIVRMLVRVRRGIYLSPVFDAI